MKAWKSGQGYQFERPSTPLDPHDVLLYQSQDANGNPIPTGLRRANGVIEAVEIIEKPKPPKG